MEEWREKAALLEETQAVLRRQMEALRLQLAALEEQNRYLSELALDTYGELEELKARFQELENFRQKKLPAAYLYAGIPGDEPHRLMIYVSRDGFYWDFYCWSERCLFAEQYGKILEGQEKLLDFIRAENVQRKKAGSDDKDDKSGSAGEKGPEKLQIRLIGSRKWLWLCPQERAGLRLYLAQDEEARREGAFLAVRSGIWRLPPPAASARLCVLSLWEYRQMMQHVPAVRSR